MSLSQGCFNFTDAFLIASQAPTSSYANVSASEEVRWAQTYVKMNDYLESKPAHLYCVSHYPIANTSYDIYDKIWAFERNLIEDEIASLTYTVRENFRKCICEGQRWDNETNHGCFVRNLPQICNNHMPVYFSKDDFVQKMRLDPRRLWLQTHLSAENHAARALYVIAFIGALICCFLATLVYLKSPGLQTVANIFIINLILANSIITILAIPIQILETIVYSPYPWIIPRPYWLASASCRLYYFIRYLGFYATSYSLALIGYERYNAICKPLESQRQFSKKRALKLVGAVWLLSGILTIPTMFSHVSHVILSFSSFCNISFLVNLGCR